MEKNSLAFSDNQDSPQHEPAMAPANSSTPAEEADPSDDRQASNRSRPGALAIGKTAGALLFFDLLRSFGISRPRRKGRSYSFE